MVRFLGYCGPTVYEILHLPRLSKATLDFFFFFKKTKRKPEGETPVLVALESYRTGILTSLDSSGSLDHVLTDMPESELGVCLAPEGCRDRL